MTRHSPQPKSPASHAPSTAQQPSFSFSHETVVHKKHKFSTDARSVAECAAMSKLMTMRDAIARFVHDGDAIVIEGFTHLICFAAGHEIIRQRRRELTLCRLTPDLIYDQLIGAGCVRRLVFSWAGNPGAGPLHALRRAVEHGIPNSIELEEYSHFGMVARLAAGAAKL